MWVQVPPSAPSIPREDSENKLNQYQIKNNFEPFWICNDDPAPTEIKKISEKISEILKRCTGFALKYFEQS